MIGSSSIFIKQHHIPSQFPHSVSRLEAIFRAFFTPTANAPPPTPSQRDSDYINVTLGSLDNEDIHPSLAILVSLKAPPTPLVELSCLHLRHQRHRSPRPIVFGIDDDVPLAVVAPVSLGVIAVSAPGCGPAWPCFHHPHQGCTGGYAVFSKGEHCRYPG
ncbi:hypothetical protein IMZ48_02175, partial [Candidatus Bathyarchaeota archaeon]|nr:hypothetical protein [Candidatus Bathyarchaeota archaeon]